MSQIKLTPSYCLLIQIPSEMQTDVHGHSRVNEPVKQNINIILCEISLILHLLAIGADQAETKGNQTRPM